MLCFVYLVVKHIAWHPCFKLTLLMSLHACLCAGKNVSTQGWRCTHKEAPAPGVRWGCVRRGASAVHRPCPTQRTGPPRASRPGPDAASQRRTGLWNQSNTTLSKTKGFTKSFDITNTCFFLKTKRISKHNRIEIINCPKWSIDMFNMTSLCNSS